MLAGYSNGDLKLFDLAAGDAAVRWETNVGRGVCGVQVGWVGGWVGLMRPALSGVPAGRGRRRSGSGALATSLLYLVRHSSSEPPAPLSHSGPHPQQFDRRDIAMNKFVAACLESQLCLFDARTQHPLRGFAARVEALPGRDATLWGVHHMPQVRGRGVGGGGGGGRERFPGKWGLVESPGEWGLVERWMASRDGAASVALYLTKTFSIL